MFQFGRKKKQQSELVAGTPTELLGSTEPDWSSFRAHAMIEAMPDMVCVKDGYGRWQMANKGFLALFNLTGVDYKGMTDEELAEVNDKVLAMPLMESVMSDDQAWHKRSMYHIIEKLHPPGGEQVVLEIKKQPIYTRDGRKKLLIVVATIITEKMKKEAIKEQMAGVFDNTMLGMLILDEELTINKVNGAFSILTGYNREDLEGKNLNILTDDQKYGEAFFRVLKSTVVQKGSWQGELIYRCKSGELFPAWLSVLTKKMEDGESSYFFAVFSDISEKKATEERINDLTKQAHYDDLTGLPKRKLFFEKLDLMVPRIIEKKMAGAIIFLGLDRFKGVNDSLGHESGDQVLNIVASKFAKVLKPNDLVSRISGDEFVILLADAKKPDQAAYQSSLVAQQILSLFTQPFQLERHEVFISASLGIAIFPQDSSAPEKLVKHANLAMHQAKKEGGGGFQFYRDEMDQANAKKFRLEGQLRKAMELNQLVLYYQPQIDIQTGEIVCAEVLMRWLLPKTGLVPPDQFIPLAEETGLIVPMSQWLIEKACEKLKGWQDDGLLIPRLAINLSGRQFQEPDFIQSIEKVLKRSGIEPGNLELEITESILMEDTKRTRNSMLRLSQMGIKLSIDDFGTGYSSLSYLKHFPINMVKIDCSFIREIPKNESDKAIAKAIILMSHTLGLEVIAEGVETAEQYLFLKDAECEIAQGYYFSQPVTEASFEEILRNPDQMVDLCKAAELGDEPLPGEIDAEDVVNPASLTLR